MPEYLIYFNQQSVGDHTEEWFRGRGGSRRPRHGARSHRAVARAPLRGEDGSAEPRCATLRASFVRRDREECRV
jgi:hypothetical protein